MLQGAAEVAYDMVSPGPGCKHRKWQKRQRRIVYPADFREGISNAYAIVREVLFLSGVFPPACHVIPQIKTLLTVRVTPSEYPFIICIHDCHVLSN